MRSIRNFIKLVFKVLVRPADVGWFLKTRSAWQRTAPQVWRARWAEIKPCLKDRSDGAGAAHGHYFLQDLWAAQKVHAFGPERHVDVGSRVDGFVAHVASFCPVDYVDIRPLESHVPNIHGVQGSVCALPFADRSVRSLSCLHVIEHIGLGRYGDPVNPAGCWEALSELQRVLAPGGQLLIGTPCGRPRVVFHAHRVFDPGMLTEALPELKLVEFSLIPDNRATAWQADAPLNGADGRDYACGLFRFVRAV